MFLAVLLALLAAAGPHAAQAPPNLTRHDLSIALDPPAHRIAVKDRVTFPAAGGPAAEFLLNGRLTITKSTPAVEEVPLGDVAPFLGINAGSAPGGLTLKRYRLRASSPTLSLEYSGTIDYGLSDQKEEYTRGFRETAGIVGPQGVYLAGSGVWYPQFATSLFEFALEVTQPDGWHVISQGSGTSRDARGVARWNSQGAMDEIYLVGGPLVVSRDRSGAVETLVYLHQADEALAAKYLTTGAQYLEMYRGLIGPYPYDKFALVENFWETGYGMPSFTLLGPEIIRFPFILHSSFPHEILHNWWGNSVFVDYGSGNWAEGLTAYLADHLVQEQRGRGAEYRRGTLQKYRDFVKDGRDFALADFRSRESAATEAVGYGKTMMVFHMLRRSLTEQRFQAMLQQLYRDYKGRRAAWKDVQRVAESAAGASLARFFDDWTTRPGAPELSVQASVTRAADRGFTLSGSLRQTQGGAPYRLVVPVVVQTARDRVRKDVVVDGPAAAFELVLPDRPLALLVDPYFDVFRKLDPRETPPSIGQVFGEPRILAVLPSRASAEMVKGYRELVAGWVSPTHTIDVTPDSELRQLPADRSIWLLGRENRFAEDLFRRQAGLSLEGETFAVDGQKLPRTNHTGVFMTRHPANLEKAIGWIVVDPAAALPGLGRKLPHYGKYSYLGFEGSEPANMLSGQWQDADSPMRVDLRDAADREGAIPSLPAETTRALAELPPVFSQASMVETVSRLAAPELEGRGVGTAGLKSAAAFIADRFKQYGLAPGGDAGTYFQTFSVDKGPDGKPHTLVNVIGYLAGTRPEWKTQSAIVSAHYDHLGRGWPDVHKGDEGRVHPGADDNASGVAVLLELARAFAASEKPQRSLVFIAFAGEEAGLAGSRYFVQHASPFPLEGVWGVINLDTVGRLGTQPISILGTGTATEWQHIFRGAGFVTGIEGRNIAEALQSSDQVPFVERGVPAVQIFTGAHGDYHRPTDTADKIDAAGLVKIATYVREGVAYLTERPERLTVTIASAPAAAAPAASAPPAAGQPAGRRVSFGTVPDFAFQGPGVRADGVVDGSPAQKAGIQAGDVILKIDDKAVANLQEFSNLLRALQPGQTVTVLLRRGDQERTLKVTLAER